MGNKKKATVSDNGGGSAASTSGRAFTISLAVPGSIIDGAASLEAATALAGQIARSATIFCIDEIVVFDDAADAGGGAVSAGAAFLARVLQYLETPQYLRRELIPMHPELRLAAALPGLEAPHHLKATEWSNYR